TACKVPTTPDELQRGVVAGLDQIADNLDLSTPALLGDVSRFVHATTQSSNAVFARTGARTAVLTTRGFGDTMLIMRATGRVAGLSVFERHHYRNTQKPVPIVDERDIFEISERVDYKGSILVPLDDDEIRTIAKQIGEAGYGAVAVCFLFSHKNSGHEARAGEILRDALPDCFISLSAEVAPVIGEYERTATAVFNAYVGTLIEGYLSRLETTLSDRGLAQNLLIVQANGGVATAAQTIPVMTVESGPAAGVVGAARLARQLEHPNVIATDVGGTTFKVAVIANYNWSYNRETVLDQYQLRLPMIDIASIGAGGGSIAWIDTGRLRVGPRSAAADPGPACYGLGGIEPTVTDADVVLGYISPNRFLDGQMQLEPARAETAIRDHIAEPMFGGDVLAAAAGVRRVVDSQMADLIRKTTLERGHDTRNFVMMAYGGAGPTHACTYGPESGCSEIIIPAAATVHSAFGAAMTDVRFSLRYSDPLVLPVPAAKLEKFFADMEGQGRKLLDDADIAVADSMFLRWLEARYRRQVHTVRVAAPGFIGDAAIEAIAEAFHNEYERLFGVGTGLRDAGIELINYGVDAVGKVDEHAPHCLAPQRGSAQPRLLRDAYCTVQRAMVDTPVYDGVALGAGAVLDGPAIIEQPGTTIVLLTGQAARIDDFGNIHITGGAAGDKHHA
ncbi:MAG: hydantoinase/oxoprolinase family protein, partial [Alphaproteobacteria bacterium]|nr:hydantoinase/oxoprolinase family protein [Alphaproteobacteria bacterium]